VPGPACATSAFVMPCSDREGSDRAGSDAGITWDMSPMKALNPCWVPLTKAGPRARVSLSGGKNPNGVWTLAGPVDQP